MAAVISTGVWLAMRIGTYVLFVLVCIANQTNIDMTAAIRKNLVKKTKRDKERHANNPKLK